MAMLTLIENPVDVVQEILSLELTHFGVPVDHNLILRYLTLYSDCTKIPNGDRVAHFKKWLEGGNEIDQLTSP